MIYLDYSATTPVALEVQDTMNKVTREFIGNANSLNGLGIKSRNLLNSLLRALHGSFLHLHFCLQYHNENSLHCHHSIHPLPHALKSSIQEHL